VERLKRLLEEYLSFLESTHPNLLQNIRSKKQIDDDVRKDLVAAIDEFMKIFEGAQ